MKSSPPLGATGQACTRCLLIAALISSGCVSTRYKAAPKDTPPPLVLNIALSHEPVEIGLVSLITYNGPGSWKKEAFWDEYVVTLRNPGSQPLTLSHPAVIDLIGSARMPGGNPWQLEKESQNLERHYKDLGIAFVRYTAPAVMILGAGTLAIAATGIYSAAAGTAAVATVVAIPVYYISIVAINVTNRHAMEKEFTRRQLVFPLTLAPGESRTGSLFFPMLASPRTLDLQWNSPAATGRISLPLDCLRRLHLKSPLPGDPEFTPVPPLPVPAA